jgi:hypothetical protein
MQNESGNPDISSGLRRSDPLGLQALHAAVTALRDAAARQDGAPGEPWRALVGQLEVAHRALALKLDLLRDRYGLLKKSSAQLADEVAWLRDQLDDLASADEGIAKPVPQPGAKPADAPADRPPRRERRYSDRWKGRRS